MNLKRLLCITLLLLFVGGLHAQEKVVTGRVSDTSGAPVANASVTVRGSKTGTQTGADGSFSLRVPAGTTTVTVSSVGYGLSQVPVGSGTVTVTLMPSNASLNEVIVVGYGTARKKDLTGSVATITSKDFQTGNISTPEQMISGKVAGVSIISNSGQPGSGSTIRIRGGSSLSASNDPLIVIDGVPLSNDAIPGATNPLSFINPNDVESFTILKDASAAAIYGTRASNGVIIITTKKGKGGKLRVNFSSVNSISDITKKVDVLNAEQFRSVVKAKGTAAQIAMLGTANTDWQNEIYQTAFSTNNNISLSGGLKNFPYRISFNYQNQDGILKTDNLQKGTVALVLNPVLFQNHLKVDINLKGSTQNTRFATAGAIGGAVSFDPTQPVYVNNKRYSGYFEWVDASGNLINLAGKNPVGQLMQRFDKSTPKRSIGNIQLDYKFHFLPDLHANLNLGYDVSKGEGTVFVPDSAASSYIRGGISTQYKQERKNTILEFYLNYVKEFAAIRSRVDLTAGYSYNNFLTTTYNFADYNAHGVKIANSDPAFPFDKPENTLLSYFGRANLSIADKYLVTATIRRDGSSKFAPAYRFAVFPSVALAWKLKEESILKNSRLFSDLKLRVGYGVTGQQDGSNIGLYDYLAYYNLSTANATYQFGNTYYQMYRPGGFYANRKWEETSTSNIALDYAFFDNRISGSIDFYYKKTKDLLNKVPQPAGANFSANIVANVGAMENKGVEFNINVQPIRSADVTWDAGFNITYNKNNITNLTVIPGDPNYLGLPTGTIQGGVGGQFAFLNAVGGPKNTFYLYKQVYNGLGAPMEGLFVDQNKDGIINQADLYKGKSADPKVFMGFSTNLNFKKWNAGFVLRANVGNYVYNNAFSQTGSQNQLLGNSVLYNASANYLSTEFKGGNAQQLLSDYYIENASFIRMDNINVAYNLGKIYHDRATLRLNATVQNVFVATKYQGLDPEVSSGLDNNFYPRPRVFSLGLNLDF